MNHQSSFDLCSFCRHWFEGTSTCAAFPRGIPDRILRGEADHRKPYAEDQGITFETAEGTPQAILDFFDRFYARTDVRRDPSC